MIGEIIATVIGIMWGACFGALIYYNHKILEQNAQILDHLNKRYKDAIAIEQARRKL